MSEKFLGDELTFVFMRFRLLQYMNTYKVITVVRLLLQRRVVEVGVGEAVVI